MSQHIPVMVGEVCDALNVARGGVYVDGTFGQGGYTRAILAQPNTSVIAFDRDPAAQPYAAAVAHEFATRFTFHHACFSQMAQYVAAHSVDGVALDVGVSSPQLDEASRGFSFQRDGALDMRMSQAGISAADIINEASEEELADIFYLYGEERFSRRIARRIVERRTEQPFTRTLDLAEVVRFAIPKRDPDQHPATRVFQALRIAVNQELEELKAALAASLHVLKAGGRLVVVAFHSLEDRIVKHFIAEQSGKGQGQSRHAPMFTVSAAPTLKAITKKALTPSTVEVEQNPRARSAKLRAAEYCGESL